MRSNDHLDARSIVWRRIRHVAFVLIDLPSIFFDSLLFTFIFWFVILGEQENLLAAINRHDCTAITYICNVAKISNNEYYDGTSSTSFYEIFFGSALRMSPLKENSFWFGDCIFNSNLRISWKVIVSYNELVQLVPEEISTSSTTMTIINSKEGASWPFVNLLEFRFDNIQDNRNSIFIIVPYNTLMSICCIAADDSILLACKLGWMIWIDKSVNLLLFHLHVLLLLLDGHDEASISNELVCTLWWSQTFSWLIFWRLWLLNFGSTWWKWFAWLLFVSGWIGAVIMMAQGIAPSSRFRSLLVRADIDIVLVHTWRWLVSDAWAGSKLIDSSLIGYSSWWLVRAALRARTLWVICLRLLIALSLLWTFRALVECRYSMILWITILLGKLLLLVQEHLFWTHWGSLCAVVVLLVIGSVAYVAFRLALADGSISWLLILRWWLWNIMQIIWSLILRLIALWHILISDNFLDFLLGISQILSCFVIHLLLIKHSIFSF